MATDTDRVIEALRHSPGLTDDEIARRTGVEFGQVARICRYPEILRRLSRALRLDGKIANTLIDK